MIALSPILSQDLNGAAQDPVARVCVFAFLAVAFRRAFCDLLAERLWRPILPIGRSQEA
jgi:hypothetical protein